MNLADAIRKAAQDQQSHEPFPGLVNQCDQEPNWESAAHEDNFIQQEHPNMDIHTESAHDPHANASTAVRLELFLSPDQLSNLFRAVAANQHTLLTLREAANYLRIQTSTLDQLAQDGELPGFLVDGKWRFSKAAIDEWLTAQQQQRKEIA